MLKAALIYPDRSFILMNCYNSPSVDTHFGCYVILQDINLNCDISVSCRVFHQINKTVTMYNGIHSSQLVNISLAEPDPYAGGRVWLRETK